MLTKRTVIFVSLALLMLSVFLFRNPLAWSRASLPQEQAGSSHQQGIITTNSLPGLRRQVTVTRDRFGVPHVKAFSDHDAYFIMGYLHAQDRFYQMDEARRLGAGAVSELLGIGDKGEFLAEDISIRELGIGRSAERSLSAYSPESLALLQSYSDGVNIWLDSNTLPPEYSALEITRVPRWRPVDSLTVLKLIQFQSAFDMLDLGRFLNLVEYQAAGQAGGFDGAKLYFEDIFRVAPFDPAVTVPRSTGSASISSPDIQAAAAQSETPQNARRMRELLSPDAVKIARKVLQRHSQNPLLNLVNHAKSGMGSNWWLVSGSKTTTGNAMLANDPHITLGVPTSFYEIHLAVVSDSSPMNVYGVGFPGTPGVFFGQNERVSWGVTVSNLDITDFFLESVVIENGVPTGTRYKGAVEPLVVIPQVFKANQIQNGTQDDVVTLSPGSAPLGVTVPDVTLIAPRRNNGLISVVDESIGLGLSIQYTGASATRELEGIFSLARARNLNDFKRSLQMLDVASLNWGYADVDGNIASFVAGKVPLREDLQAGTVDGLPPFFVRDGTGTMRNEWIPRSGPGFNYETLPFEEMPQVVNPAQGFLVSANNDPIGATLDNNPLNQMRQEGIYYLTVLYNPGLRAAKITSLLNQQFNANGGRGKVSFQDMKRIQSNVQLFDAEIFVPYILQAFDAARRKGAPAELAAFANDPAVREAIGRLARWDFSAPTGISKGYDANDIFGIRIPPSSAEISNSIAATIYTVWRSQIFSNTIDATLQRVGLGGSGKGSDQELSALRFLLDNFSANQGVGSSGLDFFEVPGVNAPPAVRRDGVILKSLKNSLDLLASDAFADAFGNSTDQNDYRWGKLHRISFMHRFGNLAPQFSIPPAGNFEDLSPSLPGLAVDGGYETIDIGTFDLLGASAQGLTFNIGAGRRYVGELSRDGVNSVQIIPGGESGVLGSLFYANQLSSWLTNDYHPVVFTRRDIDCNQYSKIVYSPSN
jgi:penicillin G amidase